jgi:spermidine synthase
MPFAPFLHRKEVQLVGISFLGLFLELALIRYINSTVQVIAYFNNFLVLSAFLGFGFGSLLTRRRYDWLVLFPLLCLLVVTVMTSLDLFGFRGNPAEIVYWMLPMARSGRSLPVWLVVLGVFFLNFLFFVPIGYHLGFCLDRFENRLVAYGYDLAGSTLGVVGFGLMSYLQTPPIVWFAIGGGVALLLLLFRDESPKHWVHRAVWIFGLVATAACTLVPVAGRWSPYYKVTTHPYYLDGESRERFLGFGIAVDKLRIQDAFLFSEELEDSRFRAWIDYYRLPYHFIEPEDVLILGGGSGNDATVALHSGAENVDVVEIDPVIGALGFSEHPHKPYSDPRVRLIVDDGRAYLRRAKKEYDLIVMNALDSHHQMPGLSTLRLESYMYTVEAFEDARRLLKPDGMLVVHLSSTRPWMGERLYWSLNEAFGREPRLFVTEDSPFGSIAFVFAPEELLAVNRFPEFSGPRELSPTPFYQVEETTVLATDDWPHLYLAAKRVPRTYLMVLIAIVLTTAAIFRVAGAARISGNLHMFLLGAGFMLLETRNITNTALLFGSTWIVNAIVIGSILVLIFVGNLLVLKRGPFSKAISYGGLFGALFLNYLIPVDFVLNFSFPLRVLAAGAWFGAPIFFASLVFSRSFREVENTSSAFGSNLMGVVIGGSLEYASMAFGLNALYPLAMAIYALALATDRRR